MTCEAIQLSEPAIVRVLSLFGACGEKRGQLEGRDRAEPGSHRVLWVHASPSTHSHLYSLTGHTTLMFVRRTVHADRESSALDRKVRIFYMELKYLMH